ncbi:CHAT domain-containing protein [Catellatospora bangladeshensis]|uniref:CHAT domain-containing protein n=1 Tax=Catellatospora bangladeshensis TaxID=310355 RepID=UPI003605C7B1
MFEQPPSGDDVTRTAWMIAQVPEAEQGPWRLMLSWLLERRFREESDLAALQAALGEFAQLPEDTPGRAKLAAVLLMDVFALGNLDDEDAVGLAMFLAGAVLADPAPLPGSREVCVVARANDLLVAAQRGRAGFSAQAALAELDEMAVVVRDHEELGMIVEMVRLAMNHHLSRVAGDHGLAERLVAEAAGLGERMSAGAPDNIEAAVLALTLDAYAKMTRGDKPGAREAYDKLLAVAEQLPPDHPQRADLAALRTAMTPLFSLMEDPDLDDPEGLAALRELADAPGAGPLERALRLSASGALKAHTAGDRPELLDEAVAELAEAVRVAPEQDPRASFYRQQLGSARLMRYERSGHADDLVVATADLEHARTSMRTAMHRLWPQVCMPLAHAYRLAGRAALSRDTALSGLRGHAWSALLQSGAAAAAAAAQDAAANAIDTAYWCAADGEAETAARALDMGRGLILHAATERRAIPERLIELGEPELAERWRAAVASSGVDEAPAPLRHHVMTVLAGIPVDADGVALDSPGAGSARLLDAPDPHEVRAALRALGMDALVYLVPGHPGGGTGFAVVVPADEPATALMLPGLRDVPAGFVSGGTRDLPRQAGPERDVVAARGRAGLDDVCDWAWRVAIGPLLEGALPAQPGGALRRVVLIPMRELTLVPWHAARQAVAGGHRYAVEQAVFSYAPSARLLCDAAWAPEVPLDGSALVLGDPATGTAPELPAARAEALAVYEAFYGQGCISAAPGPAARRPPGRAPGARCWTGCSTAPRAPCCTWPVTA